MSATCVATTSNIPDNTFWNFSGTIFPRVSVQERPKVKFKRSSNDFSMCRRFRSLKEFEATAAATPESKHFSFARSSVTIAPPSRFGHKNNKCFQPTPILLQNLHFGNFLKLCGVRKSHPLIDRISSVLWDRYAGWQRNSGQSFGRISPDRKR